MTRCFAGVAGIILKCITQLTASHRQLRWMHAIRTAFLPFAGGFAEPLLAQLTQQLAHCMAACLGSGLAGQDQTAGQCHQHDHR